MTFDSTTATCQFIGYGTTCDNPGYTAGTFFQIPAPNGLGLMLANGPCGVVMDGGGESDG